MKKLLLASLLLCAACPSVLSADPVSVTINEKEYSISTLIDRDLGPGVHYTRLRLPGYPLNVNLLRIDVTNPYNSIETTQANDRLYGTESLVTAAKRQTYDGHVALAGANANFWCVGGQPPFSDQLIGVTYNGNLRNGKIITETNCYSDQWNGGPAHTGIVGVTPDKRAYSGNNWTWKGYMTSEATGTTEIISTNKIVRDEELNIFNSHYGTSRTFRCCDQVMENGKWTFKIIPECATEVYLTMDEGQKWSAGDNMTFTVKEIKQNAGAGTLGNYDLAIVGRGSKATALAALKAGDKVSINYSWINPQGQPVTFSNLVGGNAQVMVDGELTKYNETETYNSQVYSRTGYGTDAAGKTLYIIVIDKSYDITYGQSAGCPTAVMCTIAKAYGCTNMTNFDAGGSAEMLVGNAIINKTTEGSPRAVANGMIAYSTAPQDNEVARIEFDDYLLQAPVYSSYTPRILAYNKYGALINDDLKDVVLSCPQQAGTCDGQTFSAGGNVMETTLTATYKGTVVTSKPITIMQAQPQIRIKPQILIDRTREYPMEVTAEANGTTYLYDPAKINWTLSSHDVASIDAHGVLRGIAEGSVEIGATVGDFNDATEVKVEIADAPFIPLEKTAVDPSTWKVSGTSMSATSVSALDEKGGLAVDYTIRTARAPQVTIAKDIRLYSLPDAIAIDINPGKAQIKQITLTLVPANNTRGVTVSHDVTLDADKVNRITFPLSEFGDDKDLIFFPVSFKSISMSSGDKAKTECHVEIPSILAVYNNFYDGVDNVVSDNTPVNPDAPVEFYTIQGVRVNGAMLTPGLYIRRQGANVSKIIIK